MHAGHRTAQAIAEIYDAALDIDAWRRLPSIVARAVDGVSAVVWIEDPAGPPEGVTTGVSGKALELLFAHYLHLNPWYRAAETNDVHSKVLLGSDLVAENDFLQSEFFFDYARNFGIVDVVGGKLPIGRGRVVRIGAHRPLARSRFNERHAARLQGLFPHLQRALQLRDRLVPIDAAGLGFSALNTLAIGTVICSAAGQVLFANTMAVELAARGAGIVLGGARQGIGALLADERRQLTLLVANAAGGGAGGGLSLSGREGGRLLVLVAPLPRQLGDEPGRAIVMLRPATASPSIAAATLESIFSLTPAEAEVAIAVLAGKSLAHIGRDRKVSEATLRTQLTQLLRKTETTGQRDLVRVLGLLPPLQ